MNQRDSRSSWSWSTASDVGILDSVSIWGLNSQFFINLWDFWICSCSHLDFQLLSSFSRLCCGYLCCFSFGLKLFKFSFKLNCRGLSSSVSLQFLVSNTARVGGTSRIWACRSTICRWGIGTSRRWRRTRSRTCRCIICCCRPRGSFILHLRNCLRLNQRLLLLNFRSNNQRLSFWLSFDFWLLLLICNKWSLWLLFFDSLRFSFMNNFLNFLMVLLLSHEMWLCLLLGV